MSVAHKVSDHCPLSQAVNEVPLTPHWLHQLLTTDIDKYIRIHPEIEASHYSNMWGSCFRCVSRSNSHSTLMRNTEQPGMHRNPVRLRTWKNHTIRKQKAQIETTLQYLQLQSPPKFIIHSNSPNLSSQLSAKAHALKIAWINSPTKTHVPKLHQPKWAKKRLF
jgi:hypothetical protein